MWFIGVEVEQETSAPPSKKNPGSAPVNLSERFLPVRYYFFFFDNARYIKRLVYKMLCINNSALLFAQFVITVISLAEMDTFGTMQWDRPPSVRLREMSALYKIK